VHGESAVRSNGGGAQRAREAPLVAIVDDDASVRQSTTA
jgi:hypothetical protein